jgi:transcription-repair coupling factor (superfamily II helicase)
MTGSGRQTPSSLAELTTMIAASPGFAEVLAALHSGHSATIDGAWGSSCALSIAAITSADPKRTHLIILPTIRDAEEFVDELTDLPNSGVMLFPAWESLPEIIDAGDSVYAARVSAVRRLSQADRMPTAIVTCLPALLQPVPTRASIKAATRTISVGDDLPLAELTDWLILRGFERVTAVELPGEFSIHGGILDIFPATEPDAVRIELFGDEVESIRSFDVESQRRLEDLKSISLTATLAATPPAASDATPQTSSGATNGQATRKGKSKKATAETKSAESHQWHQWFIGQWFIRSGSGIPPIFSGETESLIDSLSRQTIVILTDMQQAISEGRMYLQRLSNPVGLYGVDATMARLMEFLVRHDRCPGSRRLRTVMSSAH